MHHLLCKYIRLFVNYGYNNMNTTKNSVIGQSLNHFNDDSNEQYLMSVLFDNLTVLVKACEVPCLVNGNVSC